jgi:hypothetical protein
MTMFHVNGDDIYPIVEFLHDIYLGELEQSFIPANDCLYDVTECADGIKD